MQTPSERPVRSRRPSSHIRLSAATDLFVRFAAAERIVLRRLVQIAAVEAKLIEAGIEPPARATIKPPEVACIPGQFAADAARRRSRSVDIVTMAVARLKADKCKSRSPSKAEIVAMSRHPDVDRERVGVSKNVFRTNQDCLDIFIAACLPFDAERRRQTATPSWVVRMERDALIDLVLDTEDDRDQLTRDVMAANELLIRPQVAAIRREVVQAKAQRMIELAQLP